MTADRKRWVEAGLGASMFGRNRWRCPRCGVDAVDDPKHNFSTDGEHYYMDGMQYSGGAR